MDRKLDLVEYTVYRIPMIPMRRGSGTTEAAAKFSRPERLLAGGTMVRSVKEECLSRLILFGEASLRRSLKKYIMHFHSERPHQGKGNILLSPNRVSSAARVITLDASNIWDGCCGITPVPHE
jgi:hypothetical protein